MSEVKMVLLTLSSANDAAHIASSFLSTGSVDMPTSGNVKHEPPKTTTTPKTVTTPKTDSPTSAFDRRKGESKQDYRARMRATHGDKWFELRDKQEQVKKANATPTRKRDTRTDAQKANDARLHAMQEQVKAYKAAHPRQKKSHAQLMSLAFAGKLS